MGRGSGNIPEPAPLFYVKGGPSTGVTPGRQINFVWSSPGNASPINLRREVILVTQWDTFQVLSRVQASVLGDSAGIVSKRNASAFRVL